MQPDKPFLTLDQLLLHLKIDYNLIIEDETFAKNAIMKFSYYDLINGYQDVLMKNGKFRKGISIKFLYLFHLFDKDLQNILFKHSIMVENYFKNIMAYYLSKHCGVNFEEYLSSKYYFANHAGVNFSELRNKIIGYSIYGEGSKQQPIRHYLNKHNHVPAWILFKNIDFGKSINLFTLLRNPMKMDIANKLLPYNLSSSEKIEFIIHSLNLIRKFRNKIAHNLKFVTYKVTKDPLSDKVLSTILPKILYNSPERQANRGIKDVYAFILAIIIFIKDDSYLVTKFLSDIINLNSITLYENQNPVLFDAYSDITNLPKDLRKKLITFSDHIAPSLIDFPPLSIDLK